MAYDLENFIVAETTDDDGDSVRVEGILPGHPEKYVGLVLTTPEGAFITADDARALIAGLQAVITAKEA